MRSRHFNYILPKQRCFRFFYTSRLYAVKRIGPHNQDVISTLVGNLLGDSWGEKRSGSSRFHLHVSSRNVEYLDSIQQFYVQRGYCSDNKPKLSKQIGKNGKIYHSYKLRTWSFSSLNWLYDLFYTRNLKTGDVIKRVPPNIEELLTPRALAIWIMDDGSTSSSGLLISTESFQYQDILLLQQALKKKFGLKTTTPKRAKTKRGIYFPKSECPQLLRLVEPYMVTSMMYKLRNATLS